MRIVKSKEIRQKEILETAEKLFYKNGYAATSINQIIEKIGIAKGTFYHYFKSKDDLLNVIIDSEISLAVKIISEIANDTKLSAIQKLNKIYVGNFERRLENLTRTKLLLRVFYQNDENIVFSYKREEKFLKEMTPHFSKILIQGIKEKLINIKEPDFCVHLILKIGTHLDITFADELNKHKPERDIKQIINKCKVYSETVHKILNLEMGTIKIVHPNKVKSFFN